MKLNFYVVKIISWINPENSLSRTKSRESASGKVVAETDFGGNHFKPLSQR